MEAQTVSVLVRKVWKSYGKKNENDSVLKGTDLCVPRGSIYGLLGPSGCGKTTLLRCIVGRLRIDAGCIAVFGCAPGSELSGIPGPDVGYMPQELALFQQLTIQETLNYFGRIHSMSANKLEERSKFLFQFLSLPGGTPRLVQNLSGGQQRRVSFAVALLHEPPLLILDEPTVGVDPILRQGIWQHLLEISNSGSATVVITTHYIEEARQADRVGLMRRGKLLAEDKPDALLRTYNELTLEDVFLQLCREDGIISNRVDRDSSVVTSDTTMLADDFDISPTGKEHTERSLTAGFYSPRMKSVRSRSSIFDKLIALTLKNFIKMYRTLGLLIFHFIIPSIQIVLFCLAIGGDPKHLNVAIYNNDSQHYGDLYLQHIDNNSVVQVPVNTFEDGVAMVRDGGAWGVVNIGNNFSQDLMSRFIDPRSATEAIINGSSVHVKLDMTDQQIGYSLERTLTNAFQSLSHDLLTDLGLNPDIASIPVMFDEPVFGTLNPTYREFMAPGTILSICYFMAVGLTAMSFIMDRKEGLLDRSYVAGVNTAEVMLSHVITQFGVMVIQVALVIVILVVVFELPSRGNIIWVILLALLQGTCGMTYGLFISTVCDHENSAIMMSLGSFYPNLLLSGIIWPVEAMPDFLRYISYFLPQTYATESLRCVLSRGKGILYMPVWRGYVITLAWIGVFLIASAGAMRLRRS